MRYTLRQLEVFLATAHFENVTKAAKSLSMSQSAASGALKDLEQQFDVQLFDRIGKRLQANELGKLLRPRAESLLEQARELEQELISHRDIGHLNLGATLTIGNYLAVGLMAEFMREHPGAQISLEVANTESIARQVANFDLDIGLVEGELHHPDLEVTHWRDDELVVFCAPTHGLAAKGTLSDQDLLTAEWILREQGSGTRQGFDRAMHGLLSNQIIKLELQHTEAIIRAVEAGLGISCLSRITLKDSFARGSLVPLSVPHRDLLRAFYFVLHKNKYRSAGIESWLELCRRYTQ
ncbi:LysR family transcriptional regulator [Oceanicoccus sp. KOV_DT_Chl]|uniref:LysR family transcriptional regulator n=1 Tax=Oceanicoccus sp. KOV_DT_Chl TaxID=1904639 RepID=UPI000C79C267|nr:LysR family transcriptional regulator [Oceanicoccus sp. KOV_DT_Chl]